MLGKAEEVLQTDVLVIGGGLGGCMAAIKASEEEVDVTLIEKSVLRRGGNAATGLHRIPLIHPDFNMSWEDYARKSAAWGEIVNEDLTYTVARDSYGIINDLEAWGIKIRWDDGSFLFDVAPDIIFPEKVTAYPPEGSSFKPKLAKQVRKQGVRVLERTMVTSLLTEDGTAGKRVIGATGLNTRTGEFTLIKAKAVIIASGGGYRTYRHPDTCFAPTRNISAGCPTNVGEGVVVAFRAGAEILNMELWKQSPVWKDYEHWGVGPVAFLHGSRVIDNRGEPIAAVRSPDDMKRAMVFNWVKAEQMEGRGPVYYDLTFLDEEKIREKEEALKRECEAYFVYMRARGLDMRKTPLEYEIHAPYHHNNQAGIAIDHNGKTSLEGLYAAGDSHGGGWRFSSMGAFVFGARGAKEAAQYAKSASMADVNRKQVESEKERVFEPLTQNGDINPLEFEDRVRHLVTDYVGFLRSEGKLRRGLDRLLYFKEGFLSQLRAENIRELVRSLEVKAIVDMAEMHMRSALFRTESRILPAAIHYRVDYPDSDNENWRKHTVLKRENGEIKISTRGLKKLETFLKEVDVDAY